MPKGADSPILALLRRRDPRGFDLAYEMYAARVHAFLRRLSRRADLADDLLQLTFLRLAERGPELRADSDLRAWLFTVARNAFLSERRGAVLDLNPAGPETLASPTPDAEARLLLGDVERALDGLRLEDRELLLLVGVEGFEPTAVAAMLGVDPATLRKRLERARSRLLAELDVPSASRQASRKVVP
jgi:RNA polymerase sigma-70 factor (ECF subfamily)